MLIIFKVKIKTFMLKYLIILLDSSAPSFCHYNVAPTQQEGLISLSNLKKAVRFAMLENLNVQFVWPDYMLSDDYLSVIESIDHINIASSRLTSQSDVLIVDSFQALKSIEPNQNLIFRCKLSDFISNIDIIEASVYKAARLSVVFTDLKSWTMDDLEMYKKSLYLLVDSVAELLLSGKQLQLNLLTDRLYLRAMNNCSAGVESLTIGPDGLFYACPAFYYFDHQDSKLGSIDETLFIPNAKLYQLDHAPICCHCDAWHCRRCIWLNKSLTREVNTPGKIQCLAAHVEREASRLLKEKLASADFDVSVLSDIPILSYLDPFENRKQWM